MPSSAITGIVDNFSAHTVDETVEQLKRILQAKGVALIAFVDHSGEAGKVGMKMRLTKLFIFGSPTAGTPLMLATPSVAQTFPSKFWCGRLPRQILAFQQKPCVPRRAPWSATGVPEKLSGGRLSRHGSQPIIVSVARRPRTAACDDRRGGRLLHRWRECRDPPTR
jgi:uncharacterized protein DUF302